MRNKLFTTILILASISACCWASGGVAGEASLKHAEAAQWASMLPAESRLVIAVEDIESLRDLLFPPEGSKRELVSVERIVEIISEYQPKWRAPLEAVTAIVKAYLGAFTGSFTYAIGQTPDQEKVSFLIASTRPEARDFREFLSQTMAPLLKPLDAELVIGKEQGVNRVQIGEFVSYFTSSDSRLLASTDLRTLLRMKEGQFPRRSTLAEQEFFQKAISVVPPRGLFLFSGIRELPRSFGGLPAAFTEVLSTLGLDRLESIALSATIDDSLSFHLAVTNAGEFTGLSTIALRPNTATRAASFVPQDYSAFMRLSVVGAMDAYRQWQAFVRRMVDDVSWKEYQDALAKLREERGYVLEDILENLGEEVALAIKPPELPGIPPMLAFVAVKDEAEALKFIERILTRAGAEPLPSRTESGASAYTTTFVPGVFLSYAAKDGYLIFGLSPSSVASALAACESGKSLAKEPDFAAATMTAPRENLFFAYADMRRFAALVGAMVPWFDSKLPKGELRIRPLTGGYSRRLATIIQRLGVKPEKAAMAVVCAATGEDYLSVRAQLPMKEMGLLASIAEQELVRAIPGVREDAMRRDCLNNVRQILLACFQYAAEHDDKYPDKLSELSPYVNSLEVFCCPATGTIISDPGQIDSKSSYKFIGGFVIKDVKNLSKKVVLYESLENHRDGAIVGFADSHVKWVRAEEYRRLLKEAGLEADPERGGKGE